MARQRCLCQAPKDIQLKIKDLIKVSLSCDSLESCEVLPRISMVSSRIQQIRTKCLLCARDRDTARPPKGPRKTDVEAGGGRR